MDIDIGIQYASGLLSKDDLKKLRDIASENKLKFKEKNISGVPYNQVGEITNFFFFISPLFLEAMATGLVTNGVYDALKNMIEISSNSISGKKYYKVTTNGSIEKTAKFYLKGGKTDLAIEIPSENKEAIDLAIKKVFSAYKEANKK